RDGSLYGVTSLGGLYSQGVLFRIASDASVSTIYPFTGRSEGLSPNNGLVLASDDFLYGGDATGIYRFNPPPVALVALATSVTETTATLNGSITGNAYIGTVSFQYGLSTAYGSATSEADFDPGFTASGVSAALTGLQPFQTYHCRLTAFTPFGEFDSQDQTFTTQNNAIFNSATDVPVTANGFTATGLPLGITLGFAPAPGTVLTLVNNTGFSPISGTFAGLPNGSTVSATFGAQTYLFVINYAGGDGNDITLTAVTQAITFPAIPAKLTTDAPFTLTATSTSGLTVSYSITAGGGSATVEGSTVTLTGTPGAVTIIATQAGNGSFGPALAVTRTFAVSSGSIFTQLSSSKSSTFTLGIRADGTLWAWGYNANGNLGNGTTASSTSPVQIGTATNWKYVSAGGFHTVAVKTDGTLWTWGYNLYGQLGEGTTTQRTSPVQVGTATNWANAVAGYYHTAALKTDGTLWAWGYNSDGENGQGTSDALSHSSPLQIGAVTTWTGIAAGSYHTLAQRADGTLWAWGFNSYGQIGNNSTTTATAPVQVGTATNWSGVSGGYYSSVGMRADGTLWTWGRNIEGQIGDGTLVQRNSPAQVGAATDWQKVQSGGLHVLATKTDGTLWSWGGNVYGQLGQGFNDIVLRGNVPVQVGTAANWQVLAPGYLFNSATKNDGTLWSWGDNTNGELGYQGHLPQPVAAQFGPIASAVGGDGHTAVIKSDGTLWLFGYNANGQLGIGSSDSGQHPVPVQLQPGTQWISVAAGGLHTAAVRSDGTMWTCGYNSYGGLGDGTTIQRNGPVQVGTDTNWLRVSAGYYFTVGLRTDGTLWAWGYNSDGEMGNGITSSNQLVPVQVGTASDWATVACGGYHVLAVNQNGSLWAWGQNASGQIGDGTTTTPRSSPVQVGTATNWRGISPGQYHSVATRTDGTLWSWGYNFYGELGDGTTTNHSSPVQVGTDSTWKSAAAGFYHTYATKLDGTLWSWGYNFYNQLGNGGTTQRTSPAQVGIGTGWGTVFRSGNQTLVTTADNSLWACGIANRGTVGYAWRNQFVPDLVLPALSLAQTIAFPAVGSVSIGSTVTLAATSGSGLPASYIVSGPATLNGSQIKVNGPGLISVTAYQPGDSYWQSSDIAFQYINAQPPSISGITAGGITTTSVTLYAVINPNGTATTAKFQSGTTNAYGTDTPITLTPVNGFADQFVNTTLTGLMPATTYHFRITATNAGGTTTAADLTFRTWSVAYANWAAAQGLSGPNAGPAGDFDGDGLSNVLEWAFGTNPASASTGALAVSGSTITARGSPITITADDGAGGVNHFAAFARRKDYLSLGFTYTVQFTGDFSTWSTSATLPIAIADDGEIEIVTVPYPAEIDHGAAAFFKVGVSVP
ncbi:MAG: hypothetical protein ABI318_14820, partial [Chthoniobacteraceae bacterium]